MSLLKPNGRVLLGNWEYGEKVRQAAPFSLSPSLVKELFQESFDVRFLKNCDKFVEMFIQKFGVDWAHRHIHLLTLL